MTAWLLADPVLSFVLAALLTLLTWLFRPKVKIRWTVTHGFVHHLKGNELDARRVAAPGEEKPPPARDMNVWVLTLRVFNAGRGTAKDVEITLEGKPLGLSIQPQRNYYEHSNPDQRYLLIFPTLGPRELINVHMLDARALPQIMNVRSAEGVRESCRVTATNHLSAMGQRISRSLAVGRRSGHKLDIDLHRAQCFTVVRNFAAMTAELEQ